MASCLTVVLYKLRWDIPLWDSLSLEGPENIVGVAACTTLIPSNFGFLFFYSSFFKIFFRCLNYCLIYVHVCEPIWVYEPTKARSRYGIPWNWSNSGSWAILWVLGIEHRSSAWTVRSLNLWRISPALIFMYAIEVRKVLHFLELELDCYRLLCVWVLWRSSSALMCVYVCLRVGLYECIQFLKKPEKCQIS